MPHQMNERMRQCIQECQRCEAMCLEMVTHCLHLGGKHAEPDHIAMLISCAQICATSARFMLLGSKHHPRTCAVCAEVCDACAEDCARFDDDAMQQCAKVCRSCADSCRKMAA